MLRVPASHVIGIIEVPQRFWRVAIDGRLVLRNIIETRSQSWPGVEAAPREMRGCGRARPDIGARYAKTRGDGYLLETPRRDAEERAAAFDWQLQKVVSNRKKMNDSINTSAAKQKTRTTATQSPFSA